MNFKQWLINEVLDDVATKDTSNIEIHKKENTGGQQPSYIHNFEKDGYNYQIKLDHDILPVNQTTKSIFPELENVKKDEISGYSINLYGPKSINSLALFSPTLIAPINTLSRCCGVPPKRVGISCGDKIVGSSLTAYPSFRSSLIIIK
jgi:hypothetical protein